MAEGTEREALAELTTQDGWQRRAADRVDVYIRDSRRVHVIWQGDDEISGGSRYQDDIMEQYSRELATVKGWLGR